MEFEEGEFSFLESERRIRSEGGFNQAMQRFGEIIAELGEAVVNLAGEMNSEKLALRACRGVYDAGLAGYRNDIARMQYYNPSSRRCCVSVRDPE